MILPCGKWKVEIGPKKKQQCWDQKNCAESAGAKKSVLSTQVTLLPGDVNLHYGRQTEVDAWTDGSVFCGRRPLPFGGSPLEAYSSTTSRSLPRTRGESIDPRLAVYARY